MTSTLTPVRKRSALTKGQLPKSAPYIVLAVALILGAADPGPDRLQRLRLGHRLRRPLRRRAGGLERRRRRLPQGQGQAGHLPRGGLLPGCPAAAGLGDLDRAGERAPGPAGPRLPDHLHERRHRRVRQQERRGRRARCRRHLPRARGHRADHPAGHRHLRPGGPADRYLPRGVRRGPPAGPRHHLLRGRHDRHPLDRRRPVRRGLLLRGGRARAPRPVPSPPSRCPC